MAPMGENKDRANTQPKRTGETELQHGPELWKQPMVLNTGVNLFCSPMLSTSVAAGAPDGGSQPERFIRACCYTQVQGSPTANAQPNWKPGITHSPQYRRLSRVTGVSTPRWARSQQQQNCCKIRVGEKVGARVPASSHMWMSPCQGALSVHAYLGSLSHSG